MERNVTKFFELYEEIGSLKKYTLCINEHTCRICGKSTPEVLFEKDAHLISNFLDSHYLIKDECDNCNKLFSKWENDLAHFIRPYLTLSGISPGKSKVPIFQSRTENGNEKTRTILTMGENGVRNFLLQDIDDYELHEDLKVGRFTFRKPSFRPINIYKVFLKIALELMPPEQLKANDYMRNWLLGDYSTAYIFPFVFRTMLKRQRFDKPQAWLYKAKNIIIDDCIYPEYICILGIANLVFQFVLPLDFNFMKLEQEGLQKVVEIYPTFVFDKIEANVEFKFQMKYYDMSIEDRVSEDEIITFGFDKYDRKYPSV